jgi:large-conductance mechanosensitive channel
MESVKGWVVGMAVVEPVIQGVTERVIVTEFVNEVVTLLVRGAVVGMEVIVTHMVGEIV